LKNKGNGLKRLMQIALLSSVGALLMIWQLPYPGATWLKMELSDIPALIGGCALGPGVGLAIVFLKNILFALIRFSPEELLGLPMNTIATGTMVIVASIIYSRLKTRRNALFALMVGVLASIAIMIPANYFILPVFMRWFLPHVPVPAPAQIFHMILIFIIPFNAFKGLINASLTFLIYKRVAVFLRPEGEIGIPSKSKVAAKSEN